MVVRVHCAALRRWQAEDAALPQSTQWLLSVTDDDVTIMTPLCEREFYSNRC